MIRVNEDYVIEVDRYEYAVKIDKHRQGKNGEDVYETIGHYSSLENAIKGVLEAMNKKALGEGVHTLEEALAIIGENNERFAELLEKAVQYNEPENNRRN